MTDNEIIKGLEICASGTCEGCDCKNGYDCVPFDMGTILSLINRQNAEIERLTAGVERLADESDARDIDEVKEMVGDNNE